jgi:hypothetical protein
MPKELHGGGLFPSDRSSGVMEPQRRLAGLTVSMTTIRLLTVSAFLVLGLAVAGCSSGPTTGVLTGIASPCGGPTPCPGRSSIEPKAYLTVYSGSITVVCAQVAGWSTYRFVLPAGSYPITDTGDHVGAVSTDVKAGRTTRLNVYDTCV